MIQATSYGRISARTELRRLSENAITYSIGFWSVAHPTGPKQWNAILESGSPGIQEWEWDCQEAPVSQLGAWRNSAFICSCQAAKSFGLIMMFCYRPRIFCNSIIHIAHKLRISSVKAIGGRPGSTSPKKLL